MPSHVSSSQSRRRREAGTAGLQRTSTSVEIGTETSASAGPVASITWKSRPFLALLVLFFMYYFWTAQPQLLRGLEENEYYNHLTDAFLSGQTSLLIQPRPELLKLPDPYDPKQNEPYRLHDASLYNGRYYLYFGPTPVVTLFAPFRILTGNYLPERIGCMYFAFGAFVAGCMISRLLLSVFFPATRVAVFYGWCAILGFINTLPHLLRRPSIYETAIACGQFFMLWGIYGVLKAALGRGSAAPLRLLWAGLCLGLAFAARPQLLFAAGLASLLLWFPRSEPRNLRLGKFAIVVAGFIVVASCVAWYNYARFDSVFSFGNKYQLAGVDTTKIRFFSPARVPSSLWLYLLCPPHFQATFPFILLRPSVPFKLPADSLGFEEIEGLVWVFPLVLLIPVAWWMRPRQRSLEFATVVYSIAGVAFVLVCFDGLLSATMRYMADSCSLFAVAAMLSWRAVLARDLRWRRYLQTALVTLAVFGASGQGFAAITGYYGRFRTNCPVQYAALETLFSPLESVLKLFVPQQ